MDNVDYLSNEMKAIKYKLSHNKFTYDNLYVTELENTLVIGIDIMNQSESKTTEIVQLYVCNKEQDDAVAKENDLCGFKVVELLAGEQVHLDFRFKVEAFNNSGTLPFKTTIFVGSTLDKLYGKEIEISKGFICEGVTQELFASTEIRNISNSSDLMLTRSNA